MKNGAVSLQKNNWKTASAQLSSVLSASTCQLCHAARIFIHLAKGEQRRTFKSVFFQLWLWSKKGSSFLVDGAVLGECAAGSSQQLWRQFNLHNPGSWSGRLDKVTLPCKNCLMEESGRDREIEREGWVSKTTFAISFGWMGALKCLGF